MTNQSGRARPAQSKPGGGRGNAGLHLTIMFGGGLAALLGVYLMLESYSSNPGKFYSD